MSCKNKVIGNSANDLNQEQANEQMIQNGGEKHVNEQVTKVNFLK
jgi:hypothetical protein